MPLSAQTKPCLAAAAFFVALAILIARLAVAPLGSADLLGIAACAAAAGAFAALAFALRAPSASGNAGLQPADLEAFGTRMEARLAATVSAALASAEESRRAEIQAAVAATTPPRIHDTDTITTPAPASGTTAAKPRLGRGLLGLMHAPSALAATARPTVTAPAPGTPSSSSTSDSADPDAERAAA